MQGISIIVCSINVKLFNSFELNINETIGSVSFEIIRIDNNFEKLPITKAYNLGASKAKFDSLLFIHEDVLFHTLNWGKLLIEDLKDENTGVIGVAGSSYVPFAPIGYTNPVRKYNFCNIIQWRKNSNKELIQIIPSKKTAIKALDGVFLATQSSVWKKIKFNEDLPGFHGYDLDFSLKVSQYRQNKIAEKILIEHKSEGNIDESYLKNIIHIKKKIKINNLVNDSYNEYSAFRSFINSMKKYNFPLGTYLKDGLYFISFKRLGVLKTLKSYVYLLRNIKI